MNNVSSTSHDVQYWSRLSDGANAIYIGLAVLIAFASFLVCYFGSRAQVAKDYEIKQVQALSSQKQASSATEIAALHLQTAGLNAEAAKAKEGMVVAHAQIEDAKKDAATAYKQGQNAAALAEEARAKQEEIRKENIQLTTRLNEAVAESHATRTELTKAQQSLAEAQTRQAEAQLALQDSLGKVKQSQQPRVLTGEQQKQLTQILSSNAKGFVSIICVLGNNESLSFATQLNQIAIASGWNTIGVTQADFDRNPVGLKINLEPTHDGDLAMPQANALAFGLLSIGMTYDYSRVIGTLGAGLRANDANNKTLELIVGIKPFNQSATKGAKQRLKKPAN